MQFSHTTLLHCIMVLCLRNEHLSEILKQIKWCGLWLRITRTILITVRSFEILCYSQTIEMNRIDEVFIHISFWFSAKCSDFTSLCLFVVCRVKGGHYVATHGRDTPDYSHANRGYWTDGEESQRAPSERTLSEYTVAHERAPQAPTRKSRAANGMNGGPRPLGPSSGPPSRVPPRAPSALSYDHGGDTGSDIYVTSAAYKAPSEIR